jgi:hypothetical protein
MNGQHCEQVNLILGRLDRVRPSHYGWIARCPAHVDRSPSLSLRVGERAVLMKCFAGCSIQEICDAIGIEVRELFFTSSRGQSRKSIPVQPMPHFSWRTMATRLEQHALSLHLRSESVLEAAKRLDPSGWSSHDLDCAMDAISRAYSDAERAEMLEDVAYSLRARGLETERQGYESRCRTIKNSR